MTTLKADKAMIERALKTLAPQGYTELFIMRDRALLSGYFDNWTLAAEAAAKASDNGARGVYLRFAEFDRALCQRSYNKFVVTVKGDGIPLKDKDVTRRLWLFVDVDSGQPKSADKKDQNSTAQEKENAKALAARAREVMRCEFGEEPALVADSGNGYHQIYAAHYIGTDSEICSGFLKMLAEKCGTIGTAHIDTSVSNAARLTRLYGTANRRGAHSTERPQRLAVILE